MSPPASSSSVYVFNELLAHLRRVGFVIGVDQYLQMQMLLDRVGVDCTRDELKLLLCPLIATSDKQQRLFYKAFDEYFALDTPETPTGPPHPPPEPRRAPYVLLAVLLCAIVAFIVYLLFPAKVPAPGIGPGGTPSTSASPAQTPPITHNANAVPAATVGIFNGNENQPTPRATFTPGGATPAEPPATSQTPQPRAEALSDLLRLAAVLTAVILLLVFMLYRSVRRESQLRQQEERTPPFAYLIEVPQPQPRIYNSEQFYSAARLLRRREAGESQRLDVAATVRGTVRALGYPTFSYRASSRPPEYLALIDRASFHDHRAQLFAELIDSLAGEDIFITRYFFEGDPRLCFNVTGDRAFTLTEISNRHRGHRLLIFGDGERLLDPSTGEPAAWVSVFSDWQVRSLHTPVPTSHWGIREFSLATRFTIVPASTEGLLGLALYYESPLAIDVRRWLREETGLPEPINLDRGDLIKTLRAHLGEEPFDWLCACALHTELEWELTLHLGSLPAVGKELLTEQNLLRLTGLPWFRAGRLPDELRARLIEELETNGRKAEAVRAVLIQLLSQKPPPEKSFAANSYRLFLAAQRWLLERGSPQRLRELLQTIRALPRAEVVRDPALVPSLATAPKHFFARPLPRRVRRLIYRHGVPGLGLKASTAAWLALFTVAASWLAAPAVSRFFLEPTREFANVPPRETSTPSNANTSANTNSNTFANTNINSSTTANNIPNINLRPSPQTTREVVTTPTPAPTLPQGAIRGPDGQVFAVISGTEVRIGEVRTGNVLRQLNHITNVFMAVFSPDGKKIATASADMTVKVWDVASGKIFMAFEHKEPVSSISFSSDGKEIITRTINGTIYTWDAQTARLISTSPQSGVSKSAQCGGGRTITCHAPRCDCIENVGCIGYDERGVRIPSETQPCPGP
jgi:hypothetical protein